MISTQSVQVSHFSIYHGLAIAPTMLGPIWPSDTLKVTRSELFESPDMAMGSGGSWRGESILYTATTKAGCQKWRMSTFKNGEKQNLSKTFIYSQSSNSPV